MTYEPKIFRHEDDGSMTKMTLATAESVEKMQAEINRLNAEIDEWKAASGLECGGDPDGVTPKACRDYWENFERINTSPVLYWTHAPMGGGDSGWNQLECHPDHRLQPTLRVTRGHRLDAEVSITCRGDNDDEVVIANVLVPFRDGIAACSVCAGDGCVTLNGETKEECPWCLGVESTAMDEAKEIACALYWSWLRSPNEGGEKAISPLLTRREPFNSQETVNTDINNDGGLQDETESS